MFRSVLLNDRQTDRQRDLFKSEKRATERWPRRIDQRPRLVIKRRRRWWSRMWHEHRTSQPTTRSTCLSVQTSIQVHFIPSAACNCGCCWSVVFPLTLDHLEEDDCHISYPIARAGAGGGGGWLSFDWGLNGALNAFRKGGIYKQMNCENSC